VTEYINFKQYDVELFEMLKSVLQSKIFTSPNEVSDWFTGLLHWSTGGLRDKKTSLNGFIYD